MSPLTALLDALASGAVRVVDLTQPLSEATPVIRLPEPLANTPGWRLHAWRGCGATGSCCSRRAGSPVVRR